MTVDLNPSSGYNKWWDDTVEQFRAEAVDNHLADGENLDAINDHIIGPVDSNTLASQYSFPVVWSIPTSHSTAYATTATDHGDLQMNVVVFAADTDPDIAFKKARVLGGHIVDNVEGSALIDADGNAHAARVDLDQFQTDSRPVSQQGAQVKFAELSFSIQVERNY